MNNWNPSMTAKTRRRLEHQGRIPFAWETLSQPRVEQFVTEAKGDGARAYDGDDFVLINAREEVIPKGFI
jgi:hypothetical protein